MPLSWTPEQVAEEIRRQTTLDGLIGVIGSCFGQDGEILRHAADDLDFLADVLARDARGEQVAAEELYEFSERARLPHPDVVEAIFNTDDLKAVRSRLQAAGQNVDVDAALREQGNDFIAQRLPLIPEKAKELLPKLKRLAELEKTARKSVDESFAGGLFNAAWDAAHEDQRYKEALGLPGSTSAQWQKRHKALRKIRKEYEAKLLTEGEKELPIYEELNALREDANDAQEAILTDTITAIKDASIVTDEIAKEWASNAVFFNDNALNKLKKLGFTEESIRQDMAQIYQLVGGKLGPVEFCLQRGGNRAFASGRFQVFVQGDFNKTTLFHEIGHLVENWDKASQRACHQFIRHRATGPAKPLRELAHAGYGSNEVAFPDSFIDPYVGKVYEGGSSEVFSMGFQAFASPKLLAELAATDPEHFKLVLAICRRKNPDIAVVAQKYTAVAQKKAAERADAKAALDAWRKALGKAANTALFEALSQPTGFAGFKIDRFGSQYGLCYWGKIGDYYSSLSVSDEEQEHWIRMIQIAPKTEVLRKAYMLIANAKRLLPVQYDDVKKAADALFPALIKPPQWFVDDPKPLPKVV